MTIEEKIDHLLTYGQLIVDSQEAAEEMISKGKEMGYEYLTSDEISEGIAVYSLVEI